MTAQGKTTIARFRLNQTRILVTDDRFGGIASDDAQAGHLPAGTPLYPATRKTRVLAATVTAADTCGGSRRKRWTITTDRGPLGGTYPSHQTFWLAPDPAQGKALGDMDPVERSLAIRRAAALMQDELTRDAPAISAALELPAAADPPPWVRAAATISVTFAYQVSDNGGTTWRQAGTGLSATDIQAIRTRTPAGEGTAWRAVVELDGTPTDPAPDTDPTDPWADLP